MESEPISIGLNGRDFELTPRNAVLVRYIARYAMHNHVFIDTGQTDVYVFRECNGYQELNNALEDASYPMAIHVPEPSEEVLDHHARTIEVIEGSSAWVEDYVEKWAGEYEED